VASELVEAVLGDEVAVAVGSDRARAAVGPHVAVEALRRPGVLEDQIDDVLVRLALAVDLRRRDLDPLAEHVGRPHRL
jgi:hypothetical protein